MAAFASLLRKIVFNISEGDEKWLHTLRSSGFSDHDIQFIYDHIKDIPWYESSDGAYACNHNIAIAQQCYTNNWFTQESLTGVVSITQGSSAGTPLADVVYSLAMSRLINLLINSLHREGVHAITYINGQATHFRPASFHDDLMVPISGDASNVVNLTMKAVTTSIYVFNLFGLQLNFSANKSECIIAFNGMGANKAQKQLSIQNNIQTFTLLNGQSSELRFVRSYKHLGTKTAISGTMAEEVVLRSCIMTTDAKGLNKRIFKNKALTAQKKIMVSKSYLLTKGCFQCGTWPNLPKIVYHKFYSSVMGVYRLAMQHHQPDDRTTDADLLINYKLISPSNLLRLSRVLVFIRMIAKQVKCLLDMVLIMSSLSTGWAHDVFTDIRWMAVHEEFREFIDMDNAHIVAAISSNTKKYANAVRRFFTTPFYNIPPDCVEHGKRGVDHCTTYECPECGVRMPTQQQLNTHMKSKHQIRNPIAMYINTTYCPICLGEFHTRECILNHVRYRAHACRAALLLMGPVLTREQAEEYAQEEAKSNRKLYANALKRYHKHSMHVKLQGPLPLLYYLRFGQTWHSGNRARGPATFTSKFANIRKYAHNNKHGNAVYEKYFGTPGARNNCEIKVMPHVPSCSYPTNKSITHRITYKQPPPVAWDPYIWNVDSVNTYVHERVSETPIYVSWSEIEHICKHSNNNNIGNILYHDICICTHHPLPTKIDGSQSVFQALVYHYLFAPWADTSDWYYEMPVDMASSCTDPCMHTYSNNNTYNKYTDEQYTHIL